MLLRGLALCFVLLLACGDDSSDVDAGTDSGTDATTMDVGTDAGTDTAVDAGCVPVPEVVSFPTDDGLMLEADYYAGAAGAPAVVLLHMIPPGNTRAGYPASFREDVFCRGITVLNVDRRGAGGSDGNPVEAYEGPNGVLDAKGAVEWLLAQENAPDPSRTAVVGASNGTTTLLDFSVFTEMARTVEAPAAFVLLSGGTYTTNQNELDAAALGTADALFVYPASEAAWNEGIEAIAPDAWRFVEIDPGAHGTGLFTRAPETQTLVADFLAEVLAP